MFDNSAEAVKHDGTHIPRPVVPRKRQRLMIESGSYPEKRKAAVVDYDDERQSARVGVHNHPVDPSQFILNCSAAKD